MRAIIFFICFSFVYAIPLYENQFESKFTPNVTMIENTNDSITIGWKGPSKELEHQVDSYLVIASNGFRKMIPSSSPGSDMNYSLRNLNCSTNYTIKVAVCSSLNSPDECGIESNEELVHTSDCVTGSAPCFYPQLNTILVVVFALCFSKEILSPNSILSFYS